MPLLVRGSASSTLMGPIRCRVGRQKPASTTQSTTEPKANMRVRGGLGTVAVTRRAGRVACLLVLATLTAAALAAAWGCGPAREIKSLDQEPVPLSEARDLINQGKVSLIEINPKRYGSTQRWYQLGAPDGQSKEWRVEGVDIVLHGKDVGSRPVLGIKAGTVGLTDEDWCLLLGDVAAPSTSVPGGIQVMDTRQSYPRPTPIAVEDLVAASGCAAPAGR